MASPEGTALLGAILEELRGLRAEHREARESLARDMRALGITLATNPVFDGVMTTYTRAGATGPGRQAAGTVAPAGVDNPLRARLNAEYTAAEKPYRKPNGDALDRLAEVYQATTGKDTLTSSSKARDLLADAVRVHGEARVARLIPEWFAALGTHRDLLAYLRTPRVPSPPGPPEASAVAGPGHAPDAPQELDDGYGPSALLDEDLEDFSGVPLELPPRPTDPREGPASAAAHPWDRKGFLSGKSTDSRRTA